MDLLLLIDDIVVRSGRGGRAGRNGRGGRGGPGGPGGSSYSWTTSQQRWVHGGYTHRNVPGTDKWEQVELPGHYTTDYTHHSNSGGNYGSSGRDGNDGNAITRNGSDGQTGSFKYVIESKEGRRKEYQDKYYLKVIDFGQAYDYDDGIVEPGELGTVDQLVIKNTGSMPSPMHTYFTLRVKGIKWVTSL